MIQLREYVLSDYAMLADWWLRHGWSPVPAAILPRLGMIAEHDGDAVAAAFLYMDNSIGVCMLEWVVAKPDASGKTVFTAINTLLDFLKERALEMDYSVMLTTCRASGLAKVYERNGFVKTDENVVHFVKSLK